MATFAVTCKAAAHSVPKKPASKASQISPVGVPLTQSFHWTRPQAAVFASSSAAGSFEQQRPNGASFVRPDLVEAADEALAAFVQTTNRLSSEGRPQFRSALEQVSFETNHSLMETFQAKPRNEKGFFSRAAKIWRK